MARRVPVTPLPVADFPGSVGFVPTVIPSTLLKEVFKMAAAVSKPAKIKSSLVPLGDRVVVEREESEQKTAGGILLPDSAKDKPARGVVVSVGEGKLTDKGHRQPLQVKPGDRVVFTSYAGEPFKVGDSELLLMREDDILAVLG